MVLGHHSFFTFLSQHFPYLYFMGKFALTDLGKLVKPKVLIKAFLLCKHEHFDVDKWWRKSKLNHNASRTYKRDMISGTFGMELSEIFEELSLENYIAQITSFVVFHNRNYKLVKNENDINNLQTGQRITICAVGVNIYKSYDPTTKELGELWNLSAEKHISWFFVPHQLIPLELIEQYNSAEVGDLVLYKKSHGVVSSVKRMSRLRYYSVCSWTGKQVMVISGQEAKETNLSVDRPYTLIKKNSE